MRRNPSIDTPILSLVVPGTVLAGKFQIVRKIGRGGMGLVIEAHHMELDERVALKFLQQRSTDETIQLQRFYREARAAAKIKSEHVTRVLDVGKLDTGEPYMVMEHLSGIDLSKHLKQKGKLTVTEAVDYGIQAMDAVAEAHAYGIIHRDLKPSNLFLTDRPDGTRIVKVLDFGIAKQADEEGGSGLTGTALVFGSMVYMSPEQTKSTRDVDERTDVYALGVTLYELMAGRPPFFAKLVPEIMMQKAQGKSTPLRELVPEAPEALERVLAKAFELDLEGRFVSVAAFAKALAPFASEDSKHLLARIGRMTEHTTKSLPRSKLTPELKEFAKEIELELGMEEPTPGPTATGSAGVPDWSDEWSDEYSLNNQRATREKTTGLAIVKPKTPPSSIPPSSGHTDLPLLRPSSLPGAPLPIPGLSAGTGRLGTMPRMSIAELIQDRPSATARSATMPPPTPRSAVDAKAALRAPAAPIPPAAAGASPGAAALTAATAKASEPITAPKLEAPRMASQLDLFAGVSPSIDSAAPASSSFAPPELGPASQAAPPRLIAAEAAAPQGRKGKGGLIGAGIVGLVVACGVTAALLWLTSPSPNNSVELTAKSADMATPGPATPAPGVTALLSASVTASVTAPAPATATALPAASSAPTAVAAAPPAPAEDTSALRHICAPGTGGGARCTAGAVAWCDKDETRIACCDPALIATGKPDACGCPEGGPLVGKALASGCSLPAGSAPITPAAITEVFKAKEADFQACYQALAGEPKRATSPVVILAIELAPGGQVFDARIRTTTIPSPETDACFVRTARGLRFPPPPSRGMRFIQSLRITVGK